MGTDIAGHGDLHSDVELAMNDLEVSASGAGYCYRFGLGLDAVLVKHKKGAAGKLFSVPYIMLKPFMKRFYRLGSKGSFESRGRDPGSSLNTGYIGGSNNKRPDGCFFWTVEKPVDVMVRALKEELDGL